MKVLNVLVLSSAFLCIKTQRPDALPDEAKAKIILLMLPHVRACSREYNVSSEQIMMMARAGSLDPCIIRCIMKRVGVMDQQGFFNPERSMELSQVYVSNPITLRTIEAGIANCVSVNYAAVRDGAEGCERAQLLLECARQYQGQFIPIP